MKKTLPILLASLLSVATIYAKEVDGYQVYKDNCKVCHMENVDFSFVKANFKTLKAPPIMEVSNRLRDNIIIKDGDDDVKRELTIIWIKHYIENPSLDYSMCDPGAIDTFGIMPTLKGVLNEEEKQAVAEWIIDEFEDKTFR